MNADKSYRVRSITTTKTVRSADFSPLSLNGLKSALRTNLIPVSLPNTILLVTRLSDIRTDSEATSAFSREALQE